MANGKTNGTVKTSKEWGKPSQDFPLTPHVRGWSKKINGKTKVICGHISPKEALAIFYSKATALYAGVNATPISAPTPEPVLVTPTILW